MLHAPAMRARNCKLARTAGLPVLLLSAHAKSLLCCRGVCVVPACQQQVAAVCCGGRACARDCRLPGWRAYAQRCCARMHRCARCGGAIVEPCMIDGSKCRQQCCAGRARACWLARAAGLRALVLRAHTHRPLCCCDAGVVPCMPAAGVSTQQRCARHGWWLSVHTALVVERGHSADGRCAPCYTH